jgi:hypothetical protein
MPPFGVVGTMDPIGIEPVRDGLGQIAVPDLIGLPAQLDSGITSRLPRGSNRHSSTFSACSENRAKFTPSPSQVAPRG